MGNKYHDGNKKKTKKDPALLTFKDRLKLSGRVVEDSLDAQFGKSEIYCEEHACYEPVRKIID